MAHGTQIKTFDVYHRCGHTNTHLITFTGPHDKIAQINALREQPCRRCKTAPAPAQTPVQTPVIPDADRLTIDLTTPAGAEMALVNAVQNGLTDDEYLAGVRFGAEETFVCDGCRRRFPVSLAMSANLGTSCPDCYDRLSGY